MSVRSIRMKCSRLLFAYKKLEATMETSNDRKDQIPDIGGTKECRYLNGRGHSVKSLRSEE